MAFYAKQNLYWSDCVGLHSILRLLILLETHREQINISYRGTFDNHNRADPTPVPDRKWVVATSSQYSHASLRGFVARRHYLDSKLGRESKSPTTLPSSWGLGI